MIRLIGKYYAFEEVDPAPLRLLLVVGAGLACFLLAAAAVVVVIVLLIRRGKPPKQNREEDRLP